MHQDEINRTEWEKDENWTSGSKWLSVYFSHKDSRILVPGRVPLVWSFNFAKQAAVVWTIVCVFIPYVIAALIVLALLSHEQPWSSSEPPRSSGTLGQGVRDISDLLEGERKAHGLPAVAAAVISGDRIVARGVAGVRKKGRPERAGMNDRWHWGSCTKAVTATMIGVLVERGQLAWDTTIAEALPHVAHVMRPEYRDVTVEMLLAHRGGIRHEWDVPGLWEVLWKREGTPVQERRKMVEKILAQPPKVQPGQYFYSNCGYGIAGHMAETVMGKPWEELVAELVFQPLGMKSAGFGVPWDGEPPTDPWPHTQDGTPVKPGPMADNPPSIGPGATAHGSIEDWAKFVIEHLRGARGKNGRLLNADTYRRLHTGQPIDKSEDAYALGWTIVRRRWAAGPGHGAKGRCLHHAGSNNSWYALIWIAPEIDLAVLAVTNVGGQEIFPKIDSVVGAVIRDALAGRG